MFGLREIVPPPKVNPRFKRKLSLHFDQGLGRLFIRNQVVDQTGFQGSPNSSSRLSSLMRGDLISILTIPRSLASDKSLLTAGHDKQVYFEISFNYLFK